MQLIVDNLAQRYGDHVLFSGLSFSVRSGGALVITGDNGSGKSTLLRTLAGLMPPAEGCVRLEGGMADVELVEQCHLVGPLNAIKLELTARENLTLWSEVRARSAKSQDR